MALAYQRVAPRHYLKSMEIEVRAKIKDPKKMHEKIISIGAFFLGTKSQRDVYYGEISLYKKIGYSFLMRVRNENGKQFFLTYKGAKCGLDGVWEEYDFAVNSEANAVDMLESMGLEKVVVVSKTREVFRLGDICICLDRIENLGEYVEVEIINNNKDNSLIRDLLVDLGIEKDDIIEKGYITMLLAQQGSPYAQYVIH